MTRLLRIITLATTVAGAMVGNATAETIDPMAAKLCPILADILTRQDGTGPLYMQGQLVMTVADAYGYDHDQLAAVLSTADAVTTATCPDDRNAMLKATNKPSLADAMR